MEFKVVFVGTRGSGVTTFLYRLRTGYYPIDCPEEILDDFSLKCEQNGDIITFHCFDSYDHANFDTIRQNQYVEADIVVICYSCLSIQSINDVKEKWIPEVNHYAPQAKYLLLGLREMRRDCSLGLYHSVIESCITIHNVIHCYVDSEAGNNIEEFVNTLKNMGIAIENSTKVTNSPIPKLKRDFCFIQ